MPKTLIIAEKPSVAQDLSRALGKIPGVGTLKKEQDYLEGETLIISSAIGHLVELCMPNEQAGAKLKWDFESLPILPDHFDLQPIDDGKGSKTRLRLLIKLMKRKDVDVIVNACDAGREGELIFRYLVQIAGIEKPIKRMWMQSMTKESIIDAYQNLRTDQDMIPLAHAAMCRSESDWLVGINSTRAMTAYNSKYGGFSKTPVGRVKTPTLAIMVERENKILSFEPRDYFEVHADFKVSAGDYAGRWFREGHKKNPNDEHDRAERIWSREEAEAVQARCQGRDGQIEETKKPQRQAPPLLYDLTSLQREANGRFGFSAGRTLQLAQALYERHKALTYPRTDSRFLPEDYVGVSRGTLEKLQAATGASTIPQGLPGHAGKAIQNGWVRRNGRIFDNSKVSDHFAIIPTGQVPKNLSDVELKLYSMVVQRFVAVFYPAAEYELTTRITRIDEDAFKTDGKILKVPGWTEVYGGAVGSDRDKILVPVNGTEQGHAEDVRVEDKVTKPPPRYTEATILSAMESAGKLVDDEELAAAMSERGLGTPATRAATIDGLIKDGYVLRNQKELVPTASARRLIATLGKLGVEILRSAEMTGQWEYKLKQMEHGELNRDAFMAEIRDLTTEIVERAKTSAKEIQEAEYDDLEVPCPSCGASSLKQDEGSYRCRECKFSVWKIIASREMSVDEIKELLTKKFLGPLTGFRSRFGKDFDAALELDDKFKVTFVTEKSEAQEREAEEVNREDNILCPCPICGSTIHITDTAYVCKNNAEGNCKARLPKEMCKRELTPAEAKSFFQEGATPDIDNFISKRGRPFTAKLSFNPKGNRILKFEFPPREKKEGSSGAKSKKKAATKKKSAKKKAKDS